MGWQAKGSCKSLFAKAYRAAQARLAQSAERKALNLVVVGSSPTVGVFHYTRWDRCFVYHGLIPLLNPLAMDGHFHTDALAR